MKLVRIPTDIRIDPSPESAGGVRLGFNNGDSISLDGPAAVRLATKILMASTHNFIVPGIDDDGITFDRFVHVTEFPSSPEAQEP
jgi:hypothetical protein